MADRPFAVDACAAIQHAGLQNLELGRRRATEWRASLDDRTESLLLRRALGRAQPEDYVDWAVDRLSHDVDGPNLRILAGLNPRFDQDDIEHYFQLSCGEVGLTGVGPTSPMDTARMIRRSYEHGRIAPAEAVELMADVYQASGYQEELLAPWYGMLEEMRWGEGYFYSPAALASVEGAVRREWLLLDRALALALPGGWLGLTHCTDCGHFGEALVKEPSLVATIWGKFTRRPVWAARVCA